MGLSSHRAIKRHRTKRSAFSLRCKSGYRIARASLQRCRSSQKSHPVRTLAERLWPSSMTLSGISSSTATVTVTTTGSTAGLQQQGGIPPNPGRFRLAAFLTTVGLALLTTWIGCHRTTGRPVLYGFTLLMLIVVVSPCQAAVVRTPHLQEEAEELRQDPTT